MEPRAPLDDAELFETETPCLTIGQVDSTEELSLITSMHDRAYDTIESYRAGPYYV